MGGRLGCEPLLDKGRGVCRELKNVIAAFSEGVSARICELLQGAETVLCEQEDGIIATPDATPRGIPDQCSLRH